MIALLAALVIVVLIIVLWIDVINLLTGKRRSK